MNAEAQKLKLYLGKIGMLRWVFRRTKAELPMVIGLMGMKAASSLLSVWFALYSKQVVDAAIAGQMELFTGKAITLALIIGCTLLTSTLSQNWNEKLSHRMQLEMRRDYFRQILCGEYSTVSAYHSGNLMSRLNYDIDSICSGLTSILPSIVAVLVSLIGSAVAIGKMYPWILPLLLLASFLVCTAVFFLRRIVMRMSQRIAESNSRVLSFLQEMIGKLLIVQALDVIPQVQEHADVLMQEHYNTQRSRKRMSLTMHLGFNVMSYAVTFLSLVLCAGALLKGQMSYGEMTAITQLAAQLETPFFTLPTLAVSIFTMLASCERLRELENIPQQSERPALDAKRLYDGMTELRAENLSFRYDRELVLDHIGFSIPKGGITVITGTSGIGKSTLLKLMLGMYRPETGMLCAAGAETVPLDRDTRGMFCYAPQGNLLISGTLRDNLLLVKKDATAEELRQATYVSAMDDYLADLPKGLDTRIGENGIGLSEGQAQRLSLARAVLSDAPVMLLDEVTSALDEETERKVIKRIRTLQGRTCIVVTHRRTVREVADWHLILETNGARLQSVRTGESSCGNI